MTHTSTLLFGTLTLLNAVLPIDIHTMVPGVPNLKYDVSEFCGNVDDGYGWDEQWMRQCRTGFQLVKFAAFGVGMVFMTVQWYALVSIWSWKRTMSSEKMKGAMIEDVERVEDWKEKVEMS